MNWLSSCIHQNAFKPIFSLDAAKGLQYNPLGRTLEHEDPEKSFARICLEAGPGRPIPGVRARYPEDDMGKDSLPATLAPGPNRGQVQLIRGQHHFALRFVEPVFRILMLLLDDLTASFHFGVYCLRQPQCQLEGGYPHRAKQDIGRLPLD